LYMEQKTYKITKRVYNSSFSAFLFLMA